jgi:hypothetical protein
MTRIYDNIPVPATRAGRPNSATDFGVLGTGQCLFVPIADGVVADKVLDRVRGQVARWRKADESRSGFKFTIAVAAIPDDPLGAQGVGVWRTA